MVYPAQVDAAMTLREACHVLERRLQVDDAYLGGELSGGPGCTVLCDGLACYVARYLGHSPTVSTADSICARWLRDSSWQSRVARRSLCG